VRSIGVGIRARRRVSTTLMALGVAGLAMLLVATPATADPYDDRARIDRELARTQAALETVTDRVSAAALSYADANRRLPQVQARLAQARADLAAAKAKALSAARTSRAAAKELATADKELTAAFGRVEQTRGEIEDYTISAFKGRDIASVDALLSLTSPADFVAGYEYLHRVALGQQRALTAFSKASADAKDHQTVQSRKAQAAQEASRATASALRRSAEAEAEAGRAERDVAALVDQRQQALRVAQQERAATLAQYQELLAESARVAAEIRALAAGGGPIIRRGVTLPMPVNGWKSSDFGMRFHPIYHEWRMHTGVDLSAPGGAPIWAVAAGKVFRAGWNGGYGNFTCIYHGTYEGKGFASCYAHQSTILVRVNQQVRAGQVIGRVGTTGTSTGNHLHFEIRLNGDPVDPWPWLT